MKRLIYILTLAAAILAAASSQAQVQQIPERTPPGKFTIKKVDFDHVKKVISDPNNNYYYPKLMKAFTSNDTTLSIEAWRNFYYGYTFQEDYDPFRESVFSNKVEELYYKQPHSRAECDSIEKYAEWSLNDNMFDMNQMNFYIYVLKEKKKHARAAVWQYRLDRLIAAIMSSGKGTKEEPWVVIAPEHEYNIINFLGFVATDHETLDGGIDYIKVQPVAGKSAEGFYFDISRMMKIAELKFPDI